MKILFYSLLILSFSLNAYLTGSDGHFGWMISNLLGAGASGAGIVLSISAFYEKRWEKYYDDYYYHYYNVEKGEHLGTER